MVSRERRKELLLEITSETNKINSDMYLPISDYTKSQLITSLDPNFIYQDKFSLSLQSESLKIGPDRIKGFRIENVPGKRIIKVKTIMHIESWIKEFEQIDIVKIYFFDNNGNRIINFFDYDVDFKCFYLDCDYKFRDYLTPVFEYEIINSTIEK